jgi:hypothetical protein
MGNIMIRTHNSNKWINELEIGNLDNSCGKWVRKCMGLNLSHDNIFILYIFDIIILFIGWFRMIEWMNKLEIN